MLPTGVLLLVFGGAVFALARPLHENWKEMNRRVRAAGYRDPPFGTRFFASEEGLRVMRRVGGACAVVGGLLAVVGLILVMRG